MISTSSNKGHIREKQVTPSRHSKFPHLLLVSKSSNLTYCAALCPYIQNKHSSLLVHCPLCWDVETRAQFFSVLKMEAEGFSETLIPVYCSTLHHMPEHRNHSRPILPTVILRNVIPVLRVELIYVEGSQ